MTPEIFPSLTDSGLRDGSSPWHPGSRHRPQSRGAGGEAPPRARPEAASRLSVSGSEAGRCQGAGADVAGGSGGRSAPVYCSRRRRVLPFPAPAGPRREGGRTAGPSEQSPSASGGAGAEVGGSERAEAPPGGR